MPFSADPTPVPAGNNDKLLIGACCATLDKMQFLSPSRQLITKALLAGLIGGVDLRLHRRRLQIPSPHHPRSPSEFPRQHENCALQPAIGEFRIIRPTTTQYSSFSIGVVSRILR
jgi:hypothetical protein